MRKNIALTLICLSLAVCRVWAQSDTTVIAKNLELARQLMARGMYDESIALLDDADMLDRTRTAVWPYEKAYVNCLKGDYKAAIRLLEKSRRFRDASDSVYRLLGDCYYITGDTAMAFEAYHWGLQKFPDSGLLYNGIGIIHFSENERDLALDSFLQGIERDPVLASNWFAAAAIQLSGRDKTYGMVNGETGVCLEPDSELSVALREALLESYRGNISFPGDSTARVLFSDGDAFARSRPDRTVSDISFQELYGTVLSRAVEGARTIDIPTLIQIRRRFIEAWFSAELHLRFPCALFDYHRTLIEAGHFEAYNYWLFWPGEKAVFEEWRFRNGDSLAAFFEWFDQNPILEQ